MSNNNPHRASMSNILHPYRWRRFMPWLSLLVLIIFLQLYVMSVRDSHFFGNTFRRILMKIISNDCCFQSEVMNKSLQIRPQMLASYKGQEKSKTGPVHVLLVSYARTGSSFVGDLLQSFPNTYYYFEPLHFLSGPVLNSSFDEARYLLQKAFHCNVSKIEGFLPWMKYHKNYMKLNRNYRYWADCSKTKACFNGSYIDSYCRNHSIVVIKSIRLSLREAAKLFAEYPDLNLKIIYLSRDPRGTMSSRMKFPVTVWCKKDPLCSDSKHFCSSLDDDLEFICSLSVGRPGDFIVIRYEDLSTDPLAATGQLVRFLGFPSVPREVEHFLKTHTSALGNVKEKAKKLGLALAYSTFRNSSMTAVSWRKEMSFDQLLKLQGECKTILAAMGYYNYSTLPSLRSNMNFDTNLDKSLQLTCSSR